MTDLMSCWVISDGRRGIENQALGLAEAAERLRPIEITTKILSLSAAFRVAQPAMQLALKSKPDDYGLKPPYPQIAIGCGRQAIAPLRALKKRLGQDIFTIYVQNPRTGTKHFDLVIAPEHDAVSGENVISTIGSTNRVTNDRLVVETLKFGKRLAKLPAPRVIMLIGGKSKTHTLDAPTHDTHMQFAHSMLDRGISLLITTSRRTPEFVRDAYSALERKHDHVWAWDGNVDNPYFAFLGAADAILVTEDSTNMLTEACATGKPVFSLPMKGKPGKFAKLHTKLATRCNLTPFSGELNGTDYAPLNETARAAQELWKRYDAHRQSAM